VIERPYPYPKDDASSSNAGGLADPEFLKAIEELLKSRDAHRETLREPTPAEDSPDINVDVPGAAVEVETDDKESAKSTP